MLGREPLRWRRRAAAWLTGALLALAGALVGGVPAQADDVPCGYFWSASERWYRHCGKGPVWLTIDNTWPTKDQVICIRVGIWRLDRTWPRVKNAYSKGTPC